MRLGRFLRTAAQFCVLSIAMVGACRAESPACQELRGRFDAGRADLQTGQSNTLLFRASDEGCEDLARALLDVGASVLAKDRFGAMALSHAARAGRVAMVRLLLAHGAPINERNAAGSTALYLAIEANHEPVASLLLEHGADPNLAGRSAITPLIAAAFTNNAAIVDALLRRGADPAQRDATGKPAIVYAAAHAFAPLVLRLLDTGIDVNARYGHGLTVLMWAAGHSHDGPEDHVNVLQENNGVALVQALLDRGARVDDVDDRGRSALMDAAELGHAAIVALLLRHGADAKRRDLQGQTAMDLASANDVREALRTE